MADGAEGVAAAMEQVVLGEDGQPLSKNAQKKLEKAKKAAEEKAAKEAAKAAKAAEAGPSTKKKVGNLRAAQTARVWSRGGRANIMRHPAIDRHLLHNPRRRCSQ